MPKGCPARCGDADAVTLISRARNPSASTATYTGILRSSLIVSTLLSEEIPVKTTSAGAIP